MSYADCTWARLDGMASSSAGAGSGISDTAQAAPSVSSSSSTVDAHTVSMWTVSSPLVSNEAKSVTTADASGSGAGVASHAARSAGASAVRTVTSSGSSVYAINSRAVAQSARGGSITSHLRQYKLEIIEDEG